MTSLTLLNERADKRVPRVPSAMPSPRGPRMTDRTPQELVGLYYQRRNSVLAQYYKVSSQDQFNWWEHYALTTNIRSLRLAGPGGSTSPRRSQMGSSFTPRGLSARPSLSPRKTRPMSARDYNSSFPPYRAPILKPMIAATPTPPGTPSREPTPASRPASARASPAPKGPPQLRPGVTEKDLRSAQSMIREKLTDRFSTLARAFRNIDTNGSGKISKQEFEFALVTLNLNELRHDVKENLFEFIDCDGSGEFDFQEFNRAITAGDVFKMPEIKKYTDPYAEQAAREAAAAQAQLEKEAADAGMTVEEFQNYYKKSHWGSMTSAEMKQKTQWDWKSPRQKLADGHPGKDAADKMRGDGMDQGMAEFVAQKKAELEKKRAAERAAAFTEDTMWHQT